jgi:RNA polymerase sigma factor (sigma-70 family)
VDRDLVEQARRGDREAFTVLVHQVSDVLYSIAYRILRDPGLAEDALQNALVLAWRRIPKLRDPGRFEAWIHRILVHACYDESQRARHWTANVRVLPIEGPSTPDDSDAVVDRDEQNEEVAGLEAIQAPAALRTEHLADIQTAKDVIALLNHEVELAQANPPKLADMAAVDVAIGSLSTLREQFEAKYSLPPCP